MLTKVDLKNIEELTRKIVREEVESEGENIRTELRSEITSTRMRIMEDVRELSDRTKNVEIRLASVEKVVIQNSKKLDRIQHDLDTAIHLFDHLDVNLRSRVKKLEENLQSS